MPGLISLIIPTVGRGSLSVVLTALSRQQDPGPFEVILVSDGAPAVPTAGVPVHPRCERVVATALPEPSGVSVARNVGTGLARGAVLGFLDDDTVPSTSWVATVRRDAGDAHVHAAVGRIRETAGDALGRLRALSYDLRHAENIAAATGAAVASRFGLTTGCDCHLVDYLSGGNCWVRADTFGSLGGFDPAYRVGQDRELGLRIVRAGRHLRYQPEMLVEHTTAGTLHSMLRGRFRSGRSAAAMGMRAAGPLRALVPETYGADAASIARSNGVPVGALALLSAAAYRTGQWSGRHARPAGHPSTRSTEQLKERVMTNSIAVAFIAREKYSRAVDSMRSVLRDVPADARIYLTDMCYPAEVREQLLALLDGRPGVSLLPFDRYVLPNEALNAVVAVAEGDYLLSVENDVVLHEGATAEMLRVAQAHDAAVISPRIMHGDTGHPHYDPALSVIVNDELGHVSLVERIPRNGFGKVTGTRRVYHIEKHCFMASTAGLRAMGPFNPEMNTREQIEFSLLAYDAGLTTYYADDAVVRYYAPPPIEKMDEDLFRWRWDETRAAASNEYVRDRWRLRHFVPSTTFVARMNAVLR